MEFPGFQVCNIHLSYRDDVDSDLDPLPAGYSTASISGSSYASSSFGPHTPTSDRSTPIRSNSMDFGSSFTSSFASSVDAVPFDLTPPSSATTPYFPSLMGPADPSEVVCAAFPFTPSRSQLNFPGHSLGNCGAQPTPSQTIDFGLFMSGLGPHPDGLPQMGEPSNTSSLSLADSSPVSFEERDPMIKFEPDRSEQRSPSRLANAVRGFALGNEENMATPMMLSAAERRRVKMEEARLKTTALQEIQQGLQPTVQPRSRVFKQDRTLEARGASGLAAASNKFKCPHEGCKMGPYRRSEHLKRHLQT